MTTSIETFSNDLAALVQTTAPHIVRVKARRRIAATGVVLGDGFIATAHHVVRKEKDIAIELDNGEVVVANLVGRDPTTDLAILKTVTPLAKIPVADEVGAVGNLVIALGRPISTIEASFGILTAVRGAWQTGMGGQIDQYVQPDIVMYPGFSGGPLINMSGHMIGLNTSALTHNGVTTIPAATVKRVAESIVQHGHVKRGFLGISTQTVKLPRAIREQIRQKLGLLIVNVERNSPAEKAGLVLGDTIVSFANQPIQHHDHLLAQLSAEKIGHPTAISIVRGGGLKSAEITLTERP